MISLEIMGVLVFIINQEFSISWNYQEFIDETVIVFYEARMRLPMPVPRLSSFFFFFFKFYFMVSRWFGSIRANSASILVDSCRTGTFQPKSSCISWIGSYRLVTETCRNWPWIMPEQLKSALNEAQTS